MSIPSTDVAAVLERVDLLALIQEHVPLRRVGTRFVGLCPFHSEATPSFSVNSQLGVYYCFGCHASGDAISFVRHFERLDFQGAVEYLAQRAGVSISHESGDDTKRRGQLKKIREVLGAAIEFFSQNLNTSGDGQMARDYLFSRGITEAIIDKFQIGFSPRDSSRLAAHLKIPPALFSAAGLGYLDSANRAHDMFAGRVVFPIFDQSGNPVAFGGRVVPGIAYSKDGEAAKYKNSPETENYAKRRTLYGLNWAKGEIVRSDRAVICEGYTDVIAFFSSDLPIAVATCGTALTEDHLDRLKNFSKNIVLAFDGDKAGANATERIYEWERKFSLNVKVAAFPEGEDPASLSMRDPELLRACVAKAEPFLSFRLNRHFLQGDLNSIEGRVATANSAVALIAEHPNPLVRGEYLMMVADRCRLETRGLERRLEGEVRRHQEKLRSSSRDKSYLAPAKASSEPPAGQGSTDNQPVDSPAKGVDDNQNRQHANMVPSELLDSSNRPYNEAIRQLAQRPSQLSEFMPLFLFPNPVHTELVITISSCASTEEILAAIEGVSPPAKALLMRLVVEPSEIDEVDVIARLVELHAQRKIDELMRSIRKRVPAAPIDENRVRQISDSLGYIRGWQARLREHETRDEAVGVLLGYFSDNFNDESLAIS